MTENLPSGNPTQAKAKPAGKSLSVLRVIDKLEVGPAIVEKRRVRAPYAVTSGSKTDIFELVYSFDEDVFDPERAGTENLASMMMAQVALNYGLFCGEMVFNGHFDHNDRAFIRRMAENTAREIYVMKFLRPNPFLTQEVAGLVEVAKQTYLQCDISFSDGPQPIHSHLDSVNGWAGQRNRHAVLSSGGKDSLLSFALLKEIGAEAFPVFVNESGRHWFTALNAYRYMKTAHSETTRVWTNSDRLFSWMLRHIPFVRQDFARIRSDEYPIRLWTVAVFLFGVLPLLRKRGVTRLVIGDEFDTSVRLLHNGIPHYNGLYDQSRYFDQALNEYFANKGWGISQFSLLRSLSELLVLKIFAKRYPDYQKHQLSCHAAHVEGDRVHPCGKCEKCRRIVAMLLALDCDPKHCGYSTEQISICVQEFAQKGVHQELEGAEHLTWLLAGRKLLPTDGHPFHKPNPCPEVMKLRFHPDRSTIEEIPNDLRKQLFSIFLNYTEGAIKKHGNSWVEFDLFSDSSFVRPYAYDSSQQSESLNRDRDATSGGKRTYVLGDLTSPEAAERFKGVDVALLPVGATEQHGPHLPLDTDAFDAQHLAHRVAEACSDPQPLVLPLIPYGVSYHHSDFSGTLSVTNETLARFVYEIGMSAARNGVTKLVIINGHGGNAATLQFAAQMINRDAHIFTCVDTGETSDTDIHKYVETPNDVHAGEIETSVTMAIRPKLVNMREAQRFVPHFSSRYLNFNSKRSVEWNSHIAKISETGVLGDPTKATPEKGRFILEIMVRNLVEFVEQLKSMTLEEIHERKY